MRHVIVMTATGSIGLVAIFIVDALNLFYISLLGVQSLAAAVGFAATLLFFTISFAIGLTIATSAVRSRTPGRRDPPPPPPPPRPPPAPPPPIPPAPS